jgi:hypothetical protein
MCMCVYMYVCVCVCVYMYVCMYVYACVYIYVFMCVCICMYVCIYVFMHICVCVMQTNLFLPDATMRGRSLGRGLRGSHVPDARSSVCLIHHKSTLPTVQKRCNDFIPKKSPADRRRMGDAYRVRVDHVRLRLVLFYPTAARYVCIYVCVYVCMYVYIWFLPT